MIDPDDTVDALHRLGLQALDVGQPDRAARLLTRAVRRRPAAARLHEDLGRALAGLGRHAMAALHFDRAITLAPDLASAHRHLGQSLGKLGRSDDALRSIGRALELQPGDPRAHSALGHLLCQVRNYPAALLALEAAIALSPGHADAHFKKAAVHMCLGEFIPGWVEFEWRWRKKDWLPDMLRTSRPAWGGDRSMRRLLVWPEQGIGDQVLFGSVLPLLAAYPQEKLVAVDRRLLPIFARSMPGIRFLPQDEEVPQACFDEQIPLGSVPRFFLSRAEDFCKRPARFLKADPERAASLRTRIRSPSRLACGISWFSASPWIGTDKSVPLAQLVPLLGLDNVDFIDLQYGDTSEERASLRDSHGIHIRHLDDVDNEQDIDGLACLIEACDVVVSTSNTTAHLAGALGKPTLLLAPFARETIWCWQAVDGVSLWYPSLRVFEQPHPEDWSSPIADAAGYLEALSHGA